MKSPLTDVWYQWRDPNLKNSESIKELSPIVASELSRDSSEADVRAHIKRHFQSPDFNVRGVPAKILVKDAHGHPPLMLDHDFRILKVSYHCMRGKFLYASLSMEGFKSASLPGDDHQVELTPWVDVYAVLQQKASETNIGENPSSN